MKTFFEELYLFCFGAIIYGLVEVLFRGYTHWTMLIAGGLCFVCIGLLNKYTKAKLSIISRMLISAGIITGIELVTGLIVNVALKWHVWDYSALPLNIAGQVSLVFSVVWFFLALPALLLDSFLRRRLFSQSY